MMIHSVNGSFAAVMPRWVMGSQRFRAVIAAAPRDSAVIMVPSCRTVYQNGVSE